MAPAKNGMHLEVYERLCCAGQLWLAAVISAVG